MPPLCWICGAPADSREHKIKRSDLVRAFGNSPYRDEGGLLHFTDGQSPREVQGPNSDRLKYEPVLCGGCNSNRSQPWDKAYEALVAWVFDNEREVLAQRAINLCEVYGGSERAVQSGLNFYKYFVKAFGCRLASAGYRVPPRLISILSQDDYLTNLYITFAVYKALFALAPGHRQMLGISSLLHTDSQSMSQRVQYMFQLSVNWLIIGMYYDMETPPEAGVPWVCSTPVIKLGEIEGASLDHLIECARQSNAPALSYLEAIRASGGIRVE